LSKNAQWSFSEAEFAVAVEAVLPGRPFSTAAAELDQRPVTWPQPSALSHAGGEPAIRGPLERGDSGVLWGGTSALPLEADPARGAISIPGKLQGNVTLQIHPTSVSVMLSSRLSF